MKLLFYSAHTLNLVFIPKSFKRGVLAPPLKRSRGGMYPQALAWAYLILISVKMFTSHVLPRSGLSLEVWSSLFSENEEHHTSHFRKILDLLVMHCTAVRQRNTFALTILELDTHPEQCFLINHPLIIHNSVLRKKTASVNDTFKYYFSTYFVDGRGGGGYLNISGKS